ncbi:subunit R of type 3 restriction endonuclease [Clostridium sporogenes]|uniref:type III restriction-modification system endonuclease n=1 Tax=Clostridium TaxID=1485 RepID=UPI00017946C4|nr:MULTISPECIES: DEAD/DEAH box helicase family protein [Clostridium]EDU38503.1 type III restriction enzyme, res subunit [Clostridium sporogenes ATCC 15579]KRU26683.1 subunit R of type 3 restriction endonuclease [Clostridium sporogenes]KRU29545.1 subunit R of type 3 restriction endonuclease [Clostridium sporogenes]KRU35312.1 subunit R of type 3 restriction endonuclease [Clostridium sporogenes]KRU49538.1 subunit R of type 3 restriction endonuclease [Clostridium sporogenes]
MKLQFNPDLDYQKESISSIVNIFKGQTPAQANFTVSALMDKAGTEGKLITNTGIGNKLELDEEDISKNVREIQLKNGLKPSTLVDLGKNNFKFTVEMETGTGKTYVYLRTIFELNAKYGFTKFVIVVPSVAIKEGVVKSIDIMTEHFKGIYNNVIFKSYEYKSKQLDIIRDFATSDTIRIMVMTIQSFNKDSNVINIDNEKTNGVKPIEFIKETNPIIIIDEPQSSASTEKAIDAINSLNPLCTVGYSATHKQKHNLMFRLDAVDAYERQLVKQIEVASVISKDNNNAAYIKLISVNNKKSPIKAKLEIDIWDNKKGTIVRKAKEYKVGDDLYELSGKREVYKGYQITEINAKEGDEYVCFVGHEPIRLGEVRGEIDDDIIKRTQIRKTIEEHLNKELKLKKEGIKVLSLFFIDKVANYRTIDKEGNPQKGKYALWFEEDYKKAIQNPKYNTLFNDVDIETEAEQVHNGYFAQDKKGKLKDTKGNTLADEDAYSLIMKDKEKLLSFNTKLKFIFSHSALKEGWDNPNVFQICTLNETKSESKKRQEIGRGLRLAVNQQGERVYGFRVNTLTIMANESYEDFARKLQNEYEEDEGIRFGIVEKHNFANIIVAKDGENTYLEQEASEKIFNHLKEMKYIDNKGKVTDKLKTDLKEQRVDIPEEFKEVENEIITNIKKIAGNLNLKNAGDKKPVNLNKIRYLSPEFKELWDRIKYKTTYSVHFDSKDLINKCAEEIKNNLMVNKVKMLYTKAALNESKAGVMAEENNRYSMDIDEYNFVLPDIITFLQNQTNLTRRTIVDILKKSQRLEDFKKNPQKFMDEVASIIKRKMRLMIVDGIKYEKIGDEAYYAQELFETEELSGYLSKNMIPSERSIYEYIIYDSDVEAEFAKKFEKNDSVKLYIKLPDWFKIETPLGSYNPDWAVLIEKDNIEKLYFVVETKGSILSEDLRAKEEKKIQCGEKHFAALGNNTRFEKRDNFNDFIENV